MATVNTLGPPISLSLRVAAAFGNPSGAVLTVVYADGTILQRTGAGQDWDELDPAPQTDRANQLGTYDVAP